MGEERREKLNLVRFWFFWFDLVVHDRDGLLRQVTGGLIRTNTLALRHSVSLFPGRANVESVALASKQALVEIVSERIQGRCPVHFDSS